MKNRIEKIHFALDLGFSDYFEDENVRDLTIHNKLKVMEEAVSILQIEVAVNFAIFEVLGHEHPAAEIHILDFPSDLSASFYLLLGGYYRQAILCLRNWLEMRLLGIYFGFVEQDKSKYGDWKLGKLDKDEAPFGNRVLKRLFSIAECQRADKKVGLRDELIRLYSDLSSFTHGAGLEKYDLQAKTDNVPRYNSASVDMWFELMKRTFVQVVFCKLIAHGNNVLGNMKPSEVKVMLNYMPKMYRQVVQPQRRHA